MGGPKRPASKNLIWRFFPWGNQNTGTPLGRNVAPDKKFLGFHNPFPPYGEMGLVGGGKRGAPDPQIGGKRSGGEGGAPICKKGKKNIEKIFPPFPFCHCSFWAPFFGGPQTLFSPFSPPTPPRFFSPQTLSSPPPFRGPPPFFGGVSPLPFCKKRAPGPAPPSAVRHGEEKKIFGGRPPTPKTGGAPLLPPPGEWWAFGPKFFIFSWMSGFSIPGVALPPMRGVFGPSFHTIKLLGAPPSLFSVVLPPLVGPRPFGGGTHFQGGRFWARYIPSPEGENGGSGFSLPPFGPGPPFARPPF